MYADDEDSFDERMENSRKKMLKDEIKCLEATLAKRKAQLREADRLLKECNSDLKYARDEVRYRVVHVLFVCERSIWKTVDFLCKQ